MTRQFIQAYDQAFEEAIPFLERQCWRRSLGEKKLSGAELAVMRDPKSEIVTSRRDVHVVGFLRRLGFASRVPEDGIERFSLTPHLSTMYRLLNSMIRAVEHT